jgi:hypothetical protein
MPVGVDRVVPLLKMALPEVVAFLLQPKVVDDAIAEAQASCSVVEDSEKREGRP